MCRLTVDYFYGEGTAPGISMWINAAILVCLIHCILIFRCVCCSCLSNMLFGHEPKPTTVPYDTDTDLTPTTLLRPSLCLAWRLCWEASRRESAAVVLMWLSRAVTRQVQGRVHFSKTGPFMSEQGTLWYCFMMSSTLRRKHLPACICVHMYG